MDVAAIKSQVSQILSNEAASVVSQAPPTAEAKPLEVADSTVIEKVAAQDAPRSEKQDKELLNGVTAEMNNIVSELGISVKFRVHITKNGQYVAQLVDISKGKVIKSLPAEELVSIREKTREAIKGFLVNEET